MSEFEDTSDFIPVFGYIMEDDHIFYLDLLCVHFKTLKEHKACFEKRNHNLYNCIA